MEFKDRVANKPNRVKLTYEDSGASTFATVELADEPIEEGTPLNAENMNKLLNKEDYDYIVEQGTSGIWIYRKWASGIVEAWCRTYVKTVKPEDWEKTDTVYVLKKPLTESLPSGVFTGENRIYSNVQVCYYGSYVANGSVADNQYGRVYWSVMRHWTDGNTYELAFNIDLKGRWK